MQRELKSCRYEIKEPETTGAVLESLRRHGVDPASSVLVGTSAAHRTLASALGSRYVDLG